MEVSDGLVPLSSALRMLRHEIETAMQAAAGHELQFRLGPVELEFHVALTDAGGGEAGIRFWLVTLGAKASREREQVQTVRLTLTPHVAGRPGEDVDVGSHDVLGK